MTKHVKHPGAEQQQPQTADDLTADGHQADPREPASKQDWRHLLSPKTAPSWFRGLVVGGGACVLFTLFLTKACHDRTGSYDRRIVTPSTQAAVAPETLIREARAQAERLERRRQMALRARALAEKRAQQEARRRLQRSIAQRTPERRPTPAGYPSSSSRFRTLAPSSANAAPAQAQTQDRPSVRSRGTTAREDLREHLIAEAIDRQAQNVDRAQAVLTAVETPPTATRDTSAYQPIRAELHQLPGLVLRAGTSIPATLISHVSSEVTGPVQAVVSHPVYATDDGTLRKRRPIIPAGTRLFGFNGGQASLGDRRLGIVWNRLQFADGRTLILQRVATTDGQGTAGLEALVDNRWPSFYFHAFLTSITGATAQLSQRRGARGNNESTRSEDAAAALGRNLSDVTRQVADRNLSRAPVLEVPAGQTLAVTLTEDLVFMPLNLSPEQTHPETR